MYCMRISTSVTLTRPISTLQDFGRHFTYPHMTIAGEDLLIVMRATFETGRMEATANYYVRRMYGTTAVGRGARLCDQRMEAHP